MKKNIRAMAIGCVLLAGIVFLNGLSSSGIFIGEAWAIIGKPGIGRVGKPGIPVGAAVVAHRTKRRVIRLTAIYAATLPEECQTVVIEGTTLYQCDGTYYQAAGDQYVVVEVD